MGPTGGGGALLQFARPGGRFPTTSRKFFCNSSRALQKAPSLGTGALLRFACLPAGGSRGRSSARPAPGRVRIGPGRGVSPGARSAAGSRLRYPSHNPSHNPSPGTGSAPNMLPPPGLLDGYCQPRPCWPLLCRPEPCRPEPCRPELCQPDLYRDRSIDNLTMPIRGYACECLRACRSQLPGQLINYLTTGQITHGPRLLATDPDQWLR